MWNAESLAVLQSHAQQADDARLLEGPEAFELVARRDGISITVTVPKSVQEWFVAVEELATGSIAQDWYDYAGYESATAGEQCAAMAADLNEFLGKILTRPLRMQPAPSVLEWQVTGVWESAVPFSDP